MPQYWQPRGYSGFRVAIMGMSGIGRPQGQAENRFKLRYDKC